MESEEIHSWVSEEEGPGADAMVPIFRKSGYYTIVLYTYSGRSRRYGWQKDDYTDGMLLCAAPIDPKTETIRTAIRALSLKGKLLAFRPDVFRGTPLEKDFLRYTFFCYRESEALHLSLRERGVIEECMGAIGDETRNGVDEFSRSLLAKRIGLLLDYIVRFYERQFITRCLSVQKTVERYESIIKEGIAEQGMGMCDNLSLRVCAGQLGISEAYLEDLLREETGLSHKEYVNRQCVLFAERLLRETDFSLARIAVMTGFPTVQSFVRFFQKAVGCSPDRYRYSC